MADFVSVIIPCRNEEQHMAACLDSVLSGSYSHDCMEILVVDGESSDRTQEIVNSYAKKYTFIRLLSNPGKTAPKAMNIGIRAAKGNIIARLDAHSAYPVDYIGACVRLLLESGAANAGGKIINRPNGTGPWALPVSLVTAHPFGVGNSAFRTSEKKGFVDTVPFGMFRRSIFDEVGFYDERLTRNQDNELNDRIRSYGHKIAFDPQIEIEYKNQPDLKGLIRQARHTGAWNIYTLILFPYTFKWRRFIPMVFVVYLLSIPAIFKFRFCFVPAISYLAVNTFVSLRASQSLAVEFRLWLAFLSYHIAYGVGSLLGIANFLSGRWKYNLGRPL